MRDTVATAKLYQSAKITGSKDQGQDMNNFNRERSENKNDLHLKVPEDEDDDDNFSIETESLNEEDLSGDPGLGRQIEHDSNERKPSTSALPPKNTGLQMRSSFGSSQE